MTTSIFDIPNYVTHYHLANKRPFLNLSDLGPERLEIVRVELQRLRETNGNRRPFGPGYMKLRRLTESKLFRLFRAAGGNPARRAPHYFVLGRSSWFEEHAPDTRKVTLALSDLPSDVTSFTYTDSFEAMNYGSRVGLPHEPLPHHEQVFRMEQLQEIIANYGLPADDALEPFGNFIEVQLWSDAPIQQHILEPV